MKTEFLSMNPSFQTTEFRHAAKAVLNTKLTASNIFCGMTALENTSRAVAEAYIKNNKLTKGDFHENTELPSTVPPTNPTSTATSSATAGPSTTASATAAVQAQRRIKLVDLLQNYTM